MIIAVQIESGIVILRNAMNKYVNVLLLWLSVSSLESNALHLEEKNDHRSMIIQVWRCHLNQLFQVPLSLGTSPFYEVCSVYVYDDIILASASHEYVIISRDTLRDCLQSCTTGDIDMDGINSEWYRYLI